MKKPTMDGLRKMVSNQQQNAKPLESNQNMDTQAADWVWLKGAEIYGEQWERENGAEPSLMWNLALNKLDQSTVENGVKRLLDKRIAWPPNLPKFLELAGGIDTDAAFDRFINREDPLNDVEAKTRGECGHACRAQLSEDKARSKFKNTYLRWQKRKDDGCMPDSEQKALPSQSADKKSDHMVEERMRSNKPKTELEKRIDALRSK